MVIVDFIMKLIGRPTLLPNGYPNMARNHQYVDNDGEVVHEVGRRINGGGYYFPPPPPPIPQVPKEKPIPEMVSEVVNEIKTKLQSIPKYPSSTSTFASNPYTDNWCGSTRSDSAKSIEDKKDPLVLDHLPLKHFLMKKYPWILDITEVRIRPKGGMSNTKPNYVSDTIYFGPLEIHITVSPTHHSELMNPDIERKVRDKLYNDMMPLITCMFENNHKEPPYIIFSPSHSETILEYVK